jgi:starvation-inducible outer membrane lipoprotein
MTTRLLLCLLTLSTVLTACSMVPTIVQKDPRCTWNQHCPYTDAPPAIRTEPIRYTGGFQGEPRTVYKDPAVR